MSVPNKGIINLLINGLEHAKIMMYLLVIENVIKRISFIFLVYHPFCLTIDQYSHILNAHWQRRIEVTNSSALKRRCLWVLGNGLRNIKNRDLLGRATDTSTSSSHDPPQ